MSKGPHGGKNHSGWQIQGRHSPILSSWVSAYPFAFMYLLSLPGSRHLLIFLIFLGRVRNENVKGYDFASLVLTNACGIDILWTCLLPLGPERWKIFGKTAKTVVRCFSQKMGANVHQ